MRATLNTEAQFIDFTVKSNFWRIEFGPETDQPDDMRQPDDNKGFTTVFDFSCKPLKSGPKWLYSFVFLVQDT